MSPSDLSLIAQALAGANQDLTQNNPFSGFGSFLDNLGQQEIKAAPNYGTKDAAITALVTGLLGGVDTGLGNIFADEHKNDALNVLGNALAGQSVDRPYGMSPSVFTNLNNSASIFKLNQVLENQQVQNQIDLQTDAKLKEKVIDGFADNPYKGQKLLEAYKTLKNPNNTASVFSSDAPKKVVEVPAENTIPLSLMDNETYNALSDGATVPTQSSDKVQLNNQIQSLGVNPVDDTARYDALLAKTGGDRKLADQLFVPSQKLNEDAYNKIVNLPQYKNLSDIQSNFKSLISLAQEDTRPASIGMISSIARIWDPGGTVREGEYKLNSEAQSALDSIYGDWRSIVMGKGKLSPEAKGNLIAAASQKYNAFGQDLEDQKNIIYQDLEAKGGSRKAVPILPFSPYELNRKTNTNTPAGSIAEIVNQKNTEYSPIETLIENPGKALTSADWWLTRPGGKRVTAAQAVTGAPMAALDTLTAGMGDEITAGGTAVLDSLFDGGGLANNYNARLAETRNIQKDFSQASPIADTAIRLTSAVKGLPFGTTAKTTDGIITTGAKMAAEGAGYGAAYGFGEGEGSAENRVNSAVEGAKTGAKFGAAIGSAAKTVTKTIDALASKFPTIGDYFLATTAGAKPSDFKKSGVRGGESHFLETGEVPLKTNLRIAKAEGVFDDAKSYDDVFVNAKEKLGEIASKVEAPIALADEARVAAGSPRIFPKFESAKEFVRTKTTADDNLAVELENYIANLKAKSDGSLSYLQQEKINMGGKTYPQGVPPLRATLDEAITKDLRKTIEYVTDAVLPEELAGLVREQNALYGAIKQVKNIAFREASGASSPATGVNKIWDMIKTTGGAGVPIISGAVGSAITGDPKYLLGGIAGGAALKYAGTPSGASKISTLLENGVGQAPLDLAALVNRVYNTLPNSQAEVQNEITNYGSFKNTGSVFSPSNANASVFSPSSSFSIFGDKKKMIDDTKDDGKVTPEWAKQQRQEREADVPKFKAESKLGAAFGTGNPSIDGASPAAMNLGLKQNAEYVTTPHQLSDKTDPTHAIQLIKADPYLNALAEAESGWNTHAKNPHSTAKGLFQFVDGTAKSLGVEDPTNIVQAYNGIQKLVAQDKNLFGDNPALLYSAHFLGAPLLEKVLKGSNLSDKEQEHVNDLENIALPNFLRAYQRVNGITLA